MTVAGQLLCIFIVLYFCAFVKGKLAWAGDPSTSLRMTRGGAKDDTGRVPARSFEFRSYAVKTCIFDKV